MRRRVLLERGSSTPCRPAPPARIELEVADDLPEIYVDPDKFTQVVTNLVENAIRHGERHRARHGSSRWFDEGWTTDGVRLTVDDEGEGIPPEMRRRVFTKFWTGPAPAAAPAWASTSSTASPAPTAARSRSSTPPAAAPGS